MHGVCLNLFFEVMTASAGPTARSCVRMQIGTDFFFNIPKMLLEYFVIIALQLRFSKAILSLRNGKEECVCAGRVAMTIWLRPSCIRIYEKINPSRHKATLLPHFNTLSFSDMGGCIILIGSLD